MAGEPDQPVTQFTHREQFWSFIALLFIVGTLGLAPVVAAVYLEQQLPDALIGTIDKTISGLIGVLGAAGMMLFRGGTEAATAETARKLAAKVPGAPVEATIVNAADDPVPTTTEGKLK